MTSDYNLNDYIGKSHYSWGFGRHSGEKVWKNVWEPYSKESTEPVSRDIVSIILDTIEGSLSFKINGKNLGEAFTNDIFKNQRMYAAFSVKDNGDEVQIVSE